MRPHAPLITIAVSLLHAAAAALAGDLAPPAGPVAPTMKALDTVEPRIPIGPDTTPGDAGATYRIIASGSYYLTENLIGEPAKHGIEVFILPADQGDVSIDLNGMTLLGVPGSLRGVNSGGRVLLTNGSAKSWGGDGVNISAGIVRNLSTAFNGGDGIHASSGAIIDSCAAQLNTRDGINISDVSRVVNCVSNGNGRWGIHADGAVTIADNVLYNNDGGGIEFGLAIVTGNMLFSNSTAGLIDRGLSTVKGNTIHTSPIAIQALGDQSRIEGNHTMDCATGIDVLGVNNLIIANSTTGATTPYNIAPGNQPGAIVTNPVGAGPWDNFEQ